ncbi:MAG: endolytic transglycosylase MltG [Candidatus Eremiobacteraeota bacterium]|nr:endolytic transglycosylase MltG [Candidatus Eremiobacteraeota bacterium]
MKLARIVAITLLLSGATVALAGIWFRYAIYGDQRLPVAQVDVIVPRGDDFRQIAGLLRERGVIDDVPAFLILARLRHADSDVHAGGYRFPAHMSESDVLEALRTGGAQVAVWVTVPEGFTAHQIAQRLSEARLGSADSFERYFLHHSIVVGGTRTANLEGFLFPSTYLMPLGATPEQIAKVMTDEFARELPRDAGQRARKVHLSVPAVVTLASLIEREAKADGERPLMAGVYYNRLRIGMPLEVDATIEYVFPEHKSEITRADLQIDSPYNTYLHTGLPPTPIANPGRPSLWAAFHPQASAYLYYVYKGNGHHAFARTLQEHNANVERYLR